MRRYERSWWWAMEKKHMALVLVAITMILQLQMKGSVGCLEAERIGLLQLKSYLKNVLNAKDENLPMSWSEDASSNSDCCLWEGIKCSDVDGGHIVYLSLNQILPRLPNILYWDLSLNLSLNLSLLHSFPQLKTFNFSYNWINHVFDPIHGYKSLQRLENLRTLDFSNNLFNSSVLLPFISPAKSLRTLYLGSNYGMGGVFPPKELANMTELRVLNLERNGFRSFSVQGLINLRELEVLDLYYNLINDFEAGDGLRTTKLKILDLSFNNLSDTSRLKVLKDMPKLQELDLSENKFTNLDSLGLVFPSSLQVLNLRMNQLSSTLEGYSYICALKNLRELNIRENALKSMPYCLGNLSHLKTLDLSYNQLNGNLSSFVSGLPSTLEYLSLRYGKFNGSFSFKSLANQRRLTVFELSSTVGMIQDLTENSWVPLFQLKSLTFQGVILGSTIPGFLVHQHDLCFVDLSANRLTGAFPTWLVQNNTRLKTLLLTGNLLTKLQLPRLVHGLQALYISMNVIHDSIQEDIGIIFPKMRYMGFSSNHFYGTIPSSISEMKSLEILDVSSNDLSGQLPKTFLSSCYLLFILNLSNNKFQGNLGEGLLNSKEVVYLDVSNNRFSAPLPYWNSNMSRLHMLNLSGNHLTGPFPRHLQNFSKLHVIDISRNSFSGSIPRNLDFPSLFELRVQSNEFMGSIPNTLFKSEVLEVLDLRNNNFSGMILNSIGNGSKLVVLLVGYNNLQSHIPEKICELSKVGLMDLSHNQFKGVIPSCLGNMSFGRQRYKLTMTRYVSSALPHCEYASHLNPTKSFSLSQRTPLTSVDFLTKNRNEAYQGDFISYMYGLDLSSNQLSGEIPVEIGDLRNIRSLNLSNNLLTGSILDSISKLKDLGSLDLSNNKLDGNIPPQLADLNSLGYFNVSFNNLSGEIPFKGHLGTFVENSYIGNVHLCGLPTKISCNPVPEPSASKQTNEEEEEGDGVIDMVWFYWTCGAVYVSTSLSLFAFLCIDSRWSREWFYRVDILVHHLQRFKGGLASKVIP